MIYFLQDSGDFAIKIGSTGADDPLERVRSLQTGNPRPLVLLGTMPGNEEDERALHCRFSAHRLHGEWFRPAPQVLLFLINEVACRVAETEISVPAVTAFRCRCHAPERTQTPRAIQATDWLVTIFREKQLWTSEDFWARAKQDGISRGAIDESRPRLGIPKPRKTTYDDGYSFWMWFVDPDWPYLLDAETPLDA